MSFTDPPTKRAGDSWSSADNNTFVRDNFAALLPNGFTAVGELPVGSGSGMGGLLGIGTNFYLLVADSAQALGMKYAITPSRDLIQAKGDVLTATGLKAIARLAVGTDTHALVASMAQSGGWRWIPTNAIVARGYSSGLAAHDAWSALQTPIADDYDPDGAFANGTYIVPSGKDGVYLIAYEYAVTQGQRAGTVKTRVNYAGIGTLMMTHRQSDAALDIDNLYVFGTAIVPCAAGGYIYPEIYQSNNITIDLVANVKIAIAHLV